MPPYADLTLVAAVVRALLPDAGGLHIARAATGVSTIVYRIACAAGVYYLRIQPEPGATFAAEAAVHRRLSALGLHVPIVLHMDPLHPLLERSLMLTTAIAGQAIGHVPAQAVASAAAPAIVRAAGHELALLNRLPVAGYGWLDRLTPGAGDLAAGYPSLPQWLQAHFAVPIAALRGSAWLWGGSRRCVGGLLKGACAQFRDQASVLTHADFDVTHIFHRRASYTGIVDFGEIRGAHWVYDLAHFAVENGHLLPSLLRGYGEITPLTAGDLRALRLTSLLVAARRMGRRLQQQRLPHGPDVAYIEAQLPAFTGGGQVSPSWVQAGRAEMGPALA